MPLKHLNQFLTFDSASFFKDKTLVTTGTRAWRDHETGTLLGTVVEVVIFRDATEYTRKPDDRSNNKFEKLAVKLPKQVSLPEDTQVRLINPVCTIWGDYRNNLSVKVEDIETVSQRPAPAKGA